MIMKKFEYKTIIMKVKKTKDEELNKLGQEGWECVNVYTPNLAGSSIDAYYLFKREIE
jgi:hypothetical protein